MFGMIRLGSFAWDGFALDDTRWSRARSIRGRSAGTGGEHATLCLGLRRYCMQYKNVFFLNWQHQQIILLTQKENSLRKTQEMV